MLAYHRILLKLSGEALSGETHMGIEPSVIDRFASDIFSVYQLGIEIGVVVGGGNLFRGAALSQIGLSRITGDQMGMLATLMNALALRDVFERMNMPSRIMSAIPMSGIVDHHDRRKAMHHLSTKRIVIFAAGTGSPLVTTDTAASLRAIEIEADVLLKATKVDGIYSADPNTHKDAQRYDELTYEEVLQRELGVMDLGAFCQCRDHNMPIRVFNMHKSGALERIVRGELEGTLVKP